jgi:hypothetical protein
MSRERELLQRALDALEYFESHAGYGDWHRETANYIRAELEKPKPVECGWVEPINGVLTNWWNNPGLPEARHKL